MVACVCPPRGMQSASVCIICNQSCWRQVCLGSWQWPFPIPGDKCPSPFWNQQKSGQRKMPLLFCQVCKKGCGTMTPLSQGEEKLPRRTGVGGIGWGLGSSWWGMRGRSMRPTAGVGSGGGKGLVHETSSRRARREWNYRLSSRCGALKEEKYHCDLSCWNQRNLFFRMHSAVNLAIPVPALISYNDAVAKADLSSQHAELFHTPYYRCFQPRGKGDFKIPSRLLLQQHIY